MPTAERTTKNGTLTTRGFVAHKLIVVNARGFLAPVAVRVLEDAQLSEPETDEHGRFVYVLPGGRKCDAKGMPL